MPCIAHRGRTVLQGLLTLGGKSTPQRGAKFRKEQKIQKIHIGAKKKIMKKLKSNSKEQFVGFSVCL